jgi:hypothetical protein
MADVLGRSRIDWTLLSRLAISVCDLGEVLTKNAKVSFEPSLATVALRFTGLSGFGLILALIGFAVLHINFPDLGAYCWAVPLTLWLVGTLLLFVGAVHAFGNAPEKDVKLTTLKVCQIITGVYLGGCVFFLVRGEAGVSLFIAFNGGNLFRGDDDRFFVDCGIHPYAAAAPRVA